MRAIYRSEMQPTLDPYDEAVGEAYYDETIDDGLTYVFFPDDPKAGDKPGIGFYVSKSELEEVK